MDIRQYIQSQITVILDEKDIDGKFGVKVAEKCAASLETRVNEYIKKNANQEIKKAIAGLTGGTKRRSNKGSFVKVGSSAN